VNAVDERLRIRLFGPPQLFWKEGRLRFSAPPRALSLLIYLLVNRAQPVKRDVLAFALWKDDPEVEARRNLRHHLYYLQSRVLPESGNVPWIVGDKRTVHWNPGAPLWLDLAEYERLAADPKGRTEAVELYTADLAEGVDDEWLMPLRKLMGERQCALLTELTQHARTRGDLPRALEYVQRLLRHDPLREDAVRTLMSLRHESGDRAGALLAYREFAKLLQDEIGVEPMAETAATYRRIAEPATTSTEPGRARAQSHNLPASLTSLHGREHSIETVSELVKERRLVTLTGAGGVGKTRLALEVARTVSNGFPDGVWLVEFAAVSDPGAVADRIAEVMGVAKDAGVPVLDALAATLRPENLLLVLDNCEHLLGGVAAAAARLLADCPQIRILATSREPLHIGGERVERVGSLALPNLEGALPSIDALRSAAAVRLFFDRAADVAPDFLLRDNAAEGDRQALVTVCRRLDGIPLAIELAASRMNVLTLGALAKRLEDRFLLLVGGNPTVLPRQQTLRATLDWSHDLLLPHEQTVFRRLAIFAGGWTLEAAQAVCADAVISEADVFELLASLIEKSLIVAQTESVQPRYRLLETMRDYALERLVEHGERERIAQRHAAFYRGLAEGVNASIGEVSILRAVQPLRAELENIRTALGWTLGAGNESRLAGRLAASVGLGFSRLMLYDEAQRWCERALAAMPEDADPAWEAGLQRVLLLCGFFSNTPERMLAAGFRAEELYRRLGGADIERSHVLTFVGFALHQANRQQEAERVSCEAVTLARERGNRWYTALSLCYRALTLSDDRPACCAVLDEAAELWAELGEDAGFELHTLSFVSFSAGEFARAREYAARSYDGFERFGLRGAIAMCRAHLAVYCLAAGDTEAARAAAREALVLARSTNLTAFVLMALRSLAAVAAAAGDAWKAARLLGAGHLERGALGWTRALQEQSRCEQTLAAIRLALGGNDELATLMAEGRRLSLERAIDEGFSV
jgi:predicted ATPase/DNA-binding SARP family transcriptional activator